MYFTLVAGIAGLLICPFAGRRSKRPLDGAFTLRRWCFDCPSRVKGRRLGLLSPGTARDTTRLATVPVPGFFSDDLGRGGEADARRAQYATLFHHRFHFI